MLNYKLSVSVTIKPTFSHFFSSVGTNSSTLKAGNGFAGLKCSTIVILEDT